MSLKLVKNSCYTELLSDSESLANIFDGKIYSLRVLSDKERQEISSFLYDRGISHKWVIS